MLKLNGPLLGSTAGNGCAAAAPEIGTAADGGRPAAGTARLRDARHCEPCCRRPVLHACMAAPAHVHDKNLAVSAQGTKLRDAAGHKARVDHRQLSADTATGD